MNHIPRFHHARKLSTRSCRPTQATEQADEKLCSHSCLHSPRPQAADNKAPQAGNLFSPSLEAEESSLSWTRDPNTGLLWMAPTSALRARPRRRASTRPAFACHRVRCDQHRLTLFVQDPPLPGKYQALLNL